MRLGRAIERYYDDENICNGVYVGLGAAGIGTGIALATQGDPALAASGYPVMAIGAVQVVLGVVYLALTPAWRREARAQLARAPAVLRREEGARIASVEPLFPYFKLGEAVVIATGLGLGSAGAATQHDVLLGAGTGLALSAVGQLTMEHLVHDVAKRYRRELER
jgi:hypothetical protein